MNAAASHPTRYLIADGQEILRDDTRRNAYVVYRYYSDAIESAIEFARERASDRVGVYTMTDAECVAMIVREQHGTRLRAIKAALPFAPNGMSWLDYIGEPGA